MTARLTAQDDNSANGSGRYGLVEYESPGLTGRRATPDGEVRVANRVGFRTRRTSRHGRDVPNGEPEVPARRRNRFGWGPRRHGGGVYPWREARADRRRSESEQRVGWPPHVGAVARGERRERSAGTTLCRGGELDLGAPYLLPILSHAIWRRYEPRRHEIAPRRGGARAFDPLCALVGDH